GIFPKADLQTFDKASAQTYVARRSKQTFRGKPIQRETITKELQTFRQAWSWVASREADIRPPSFTLKELSFPKAREKLPFMSCSRIGRYAARGGLNTSEIRALWDGLWLGTRQGRGCLEYVHEAVVASFLYPMFCFAAYTGARRSELCRSRVGDWRF